LNDADNISPLVGLARRLSEPSIVNYSTIVAELEALGFEKLPVRIPVRKDAMKITDSAVYKKGDFTVQVNQSEGREGKQMFSSFALSVLSKGEPLANVVRDVSGWLGTEPEYPAKDAQFAVIESAASWTPISLSETRKWLEQPVGALAHISVSDMGFGISITRSVMKVN
jgi:hypothetical protein